jgi:AraC-like DNA-binding protein
MAYARVIAGALRRGGIAPDAALKAAQITPIQLQKARGRISALQMEWLSGAAMQALDDEALGWFRRRLPWGSYGMLVRASVTAPTLGVAMKRWCRHHNLLTDDITLRVSSSDGLAHIDLLEHPERHDLGQLRELCIVSVLRNALGVACWLTDSRISLTHTRLHLAASAHAPRYQVLFDGPVEFEPRAAPPMSRISFDVGYLNLPVRRDESALQRMLQRALLLTVRPYRRDRLLVEKVRQVLAERSVQARNADDVATHLGLSTRTLHRQLKEEGASLQQLKDSVRRERALALLLQTRKPIKQVAAEVGFANDKSFMRAFRLWTGKTVEDVRGT